MKTIKKLLSNDAVFVAIVSSVLSLLVGALIILLLGKNPLTAYVNLLQGSGLLPKGKYGGGQSMLTDFVSFVDAWTPMIFAALSFAVAMKAGLFNIGISGQMLAAGFISTVFIGYSGLNAFAAKPLVILTGMVVGSLAGACIGWLKYRFNINEVVSSIMINYIFVFVISFFINTRYLNPVSRRSREVSAASRLTLHQFEIGGYRYDIPLGFGLALLAAVAVGFLFNRTVLGYEIKAVGLNRVSAEYSGINSKRTIFVAMALSGALAGLSGVTYYLGHYASIGPRILPQTGFNSIAVSILGNNAPLGILFSSFFIEIIGKGSAYMSSRSGLDTEIASIITALILLSSACSAYYLSLRESFRSRRKADG